MLINKVKTFYHKLAESGKIVWIVFFIALFIRLINLNAFPQGFHMDEVANSYIGRFILTNGKDIYGNTWPVFFVNKFGDYPPVLPMYLAGLSTFIFGLNEFAARFPTALIGSLAVFPLYSLFKIFVSGDFALAGIIIMTILPWHVSLSRASSEGIIGLTVSIWALNLLFKGIISENYRKIIYSWPLFLLTYLIYPAFRLVVPIAVIPLPFIYFKNKTVKKYLIASILVLFTVTFAVSLTSWGRGRFVQTSLFSNRTDAGVISNDIQGLIFNDGSGSNIFLTRAFHNKVIGYAQRLIEQYFYYLSPMYWFIKEEMPVRYQIPHSGLIYLSFGLLLLGFLLPKRYQSDQKISYYMLYLFFLTIIPAAITVDDTPNLHRSIFLAFPVIFFLTLGLFHWKEQLTKFRFKNFIVAGFAVVLFVELVYTGHQYFQHAGFTRSYTRSGGNKELAIYLRDQTKNYNLIYAPQIDWLPIYYLFYTNDFNSRYIGQFPDNFKINKIGKVEFMDFLCPSHQLQENHRQFDIRTTLVVDQGDCDKYGWYSVKSMIYRYDGTPAYQVLEIH